MGELKLRHWMRPLRERATHRYWMDNMGPSLAEQMLFKIQEEETTGKALWGERVLCTGSRGHGWLWWGLGMGRSPRDLLQDPWEDTEEETSSGRWAANRYNHFPRALTVRECKSFSWVWLFATPWTIAHQAPLSMRFSRQEHWKGLPLLPQEGSSQPRDQTQVSCIAGRFFTIWATRKAQHMPNMRNHFNKHLASRKWFVGL